MFTDGIYEVRSKVGVSIQSDLFLQIEESLLRSVAIMQVLGTSSLASLFRSGGCCLILFSKVCKNQTANQILPL